MQFVYKPEGAEPRTWDFKPTKLLNVESELIEDVTGWTYQQFGEKFMSGSMKAYHALLWILLKRQNPKLRYDQVQFSMDEIDVDLDQDEKRLVVDELQGRPDLDPEQQQALMEMLADLPPAEEPDPKEASPAKTSGGDTSGGSPNFSI